MQSPSKIKQDTVFLSSAVMLERLGYYGYRSLLVLFLIQGSMKMDPEDAFEWSALLITAIPLSRVLGGLCSDLLLGSKWGIFTGGIAQTAGIVLMATGSYLLFLPGMVLLIAGNALFSPAVYARIGRSFTAVPYKMDGVYTLTYCTANLGAFLAPLTIGWIGEEIGFEIGFGIAAACVLASGLAALTLSNDEPYKPKERAERTDTSLVVLLAGGVFLALMFYWAFYQMIDGEIVNQVTDHNSWLRISSFRLYVFCFTLVVCIVLTILWFFVKMNTFLKIGIGLLLSAIGPFLFLQFGTTPSAELQLFMVYTALFGIGEVLVTPLLLSALVQHANPKYFASLIGATSLFSWLLPTLLMEKGYELDGIISMSLPWIGTIGFLITGIVTLVLVFALKGHSNASGHNDQERKTSG